MRKSLLVLTLLLGAAPSWAQDVLTLGSTSATAGSTVQIPVYIRDVGGTTLGTDAGAGKLIGGYAFKVLYPSSRIASMTFARAGVAAIATPLYETTFSGSDYVSAVGAFSEANPIAFTLNAAAPGNRIGTLTVTLQGSIPTGTVIPLTLEAPGAMLSSQSSADRETIALGNLTLVNGSITVSSIAAPTNLVATANSASQVGVTWNAVGGADHYEVWRSFNGGAYANAGTSFGTSFTDNGVSAGITYLYRVRAVTAGGEFSDYSNTDAATTVAYTDDPLTPFVTTVKAVHFTELRTAVNAMRASALLAPLAADATVAVGQLVRASHVTSLRAGLDQARTAIGLTALTYTDAPPVVIKVAHVHDLRNGAK